MGCFGETSIGANYPFKCIRKGSSKIWKKLLRKDSAIYCVHHAIIREDKFRESKYSKLKIEENEDVELMKYQRVNDEEKNPKATIFEQSTEENDVSTINNETVGQDLSGVAEDIVSHSNKTADNSINLNNNEAGDHWVMGSDKETHEFASSSTNYDTNSIDSISVQGEKVIVQVQLENLKLSNDKQEIVSEGDFESQVLLPITDGKISVHEISQKTTDSEEKLDFSEKRDDQDDHQMNKISLNESQEKDFHLDCNSEKSHPSLATENFVSNKNECDKKHNVKIDNKNLVEAEIGIRSPSSEIESMKYAPPEHSEHKAEETNDQCSTPVKIKIKVFENKRSQLSDFDIDKNEKYKEQKDETNCSCMGFQKSNMENRRQKVIHLVNLYEKQAFPSPISKITSAKIPSFHTSIQKIEEETSGLTESEIMPVTVSCLRNPKRKNLSKEYDLIEYSSVRLESLMTQADGFNSGYQQKWNSDYQTSFRMKTPRKEKSPNNKLSIEEESFLCEQNTAVNERTHNIPNDAELIERKKKYQAMLAWMWTWMF